MQREVGLPMIDFQNQTVSSHYTFTSFSVAVIELFTQSTVQVKTGQKGKWCTFYGLVKKSNGLHYLKTTVKIKIAYAATNSL